MCIVRSVSLLPIDQVTTCVPSEQMVLPESTGKCAHAGIAVNATKSATTANEVTTTVPLRCADIPARARASVPTVPPSP